LREFLGGLGGAFCFQRYLMATCEVCGKEYAQELRDLVAGGVHIRQFRMWHPRWLPILSSIASRVIGHGVEGVAYFFCCAIASRSSTSADVRGSAA